MQGAAPIILELLRRNNAILIGNFKLTSGVTSPIYIDARSLLGDPEAVSIITAMLASLTARYIGEVDVVAGLATAGVPWATLLARHYAKPLAYIRPKAKGHGLGRLIEGADCSGRRVLLVDDVATTGGSLLHGVEAVRAVGGVVRAAIVIVDRGQGAAELLSGAGVELLSLTTLSSLLAIMVERGLISPDLLGGGAARF